MQTESALLRLPPTGLLARPSWPRAELAAKGTGADPQGHYSTTIPAPAISSSSQGRTYGVLHTTRSRRAQHSL